MTLSLVSEAFTPAATVAAPVRKSAALVEDLILIAALSCFMAACAFLCVSLVG
jgi:hypothetical protein